VYNRCFDEQNQLRIRLECTAIEGVYALAEAGRLELTWSFMLDYENGLNPHPDRKEWVELYPNAYGYNCPVATNSNFGLDGSGAAKVQTKGCASRGVRPTRDATSSLPATIH
jgi:hypothetical protein